METAVNYTYDIPSSHTRSSDCLELDFKLGNHNKHKDMLFTPINHSMPEKWLSVVEKFSNDIHHRAFPLPPSVSLLAAHPDVTSSGALNGLQTYSNKFQDLPHINGYDPKIVLGEAEFLPMKQEILSNGRNFGSVFSSSIPLKLPAKKKKCRPKKQAAVGSLPSLPDTSVKDEATRANRISSIGEFSDLTSTELKKNLLVSKVKENGKNVGENKTVPSNESIINGDAASSIEEQSQTICATSATVPPQVPSTILPMSHFMESGSQEDVSTLPSYKGCKKNSKGPAKRKAPKTIVRDSYKKSKHKSKPKPSRNCSVDSTSQLRDQFFLDTRRTYEPTSLHGSSHGYLANEYMQQYISAELYEQYIKAGEPNFDVSSWNKSVHHSGRTNFENIFNCNQNDGLSLRHDLEPGEVLRLESDSALQRDTARYSSHLAKDNTVNSDLLYIYYSKFYETFHQLALQQSSEQDGSTFASLATPVSAQVPSSLVESSNSSNDTAFLNKPCSLENNPQEVHATSSSIKNGGLSISEKRKFPELQISQVFDHEDQRRKRQCIGLSHDEHIVNGSSKNESSPTTKETLAEAVGESNDPDEAADFPSPTNGVKSSEAANGLDDCTAMNMKTSSIGCALDVISKADEPVLDSSSHAEDGKCEKNALIVRASGDSDAEINAHQSVDTLFDTKEKDYIHVNADSEVPHQASDSIELPTILSNKSKESLPYIPLKKILGSLADEPKEPEASGLPTYEAKICAASLDVEANVPSGAESPNADLSSLADVPFNLTTKINFIKLLQALSVSSDQRGVPEKTEPCTSVEEVPAVDLVDLNEDEFLCSKVENDLPVVDTQYTGPILKVPSVDAVSLLVSSSKIGSDSTQAGGNSNVSANASSAELPSTIENDALETTKLTLEESELIEDKPVPTAETSLIAYSSNQDGSLFQSRLSSRSSSVCTDELFEKDDSDELQKQFDALALTADEHEQVEKIEWSMWMERLAGTSLEFLVKDDPPKNFDEDQDQDDIDEILKNVRETISLRKQELEEKKRLEKEQALAQCLKVDMKNESCVLEDTGIKGEGGENSEHSFTARDTSSNSDILRELSKRGFLITNTTEEADDSHVELWTTPGKLAGDLAACGGLCSQNQDCGGFIFNKTEFPWCHLVVDASVAGAAANVWQAAYRMNTYRDGLFHLHGLPPTRMSWNETRQRCLDIGMDLPPYPISVRDRAVLSIQMNPWLSVDLHRTSDGKFLAMRDSSPVADSVVNSNMGRDQPDHEGSACIIVYCRSLKYFIVGCGWKYMMSPSCMSSSHVIV
ncbi:hypothetical protein FHG87_006142 [Trinorchestia longiramus]|nr:hypothetical protein FHG87_006142 [Trinorchestia longiramus]